MNDDRTVASAPPVAGSSRHSVWTLRLVTIACLLALFGIAVSLLHFLVPSPLLFALFMTIGQGSFGLAMLLYFAVIFLDLRRSKVL